MLTGDYTRSFRRRLLMAWLHITPNFFAAGVRVAGRWHHHPTEQHAELCAEREAGWRDPGTGTQGGKTSDEENFISVQFSFQFLHMNRTLKGIK